MRKVRKFIIMLYCTCLYELELQDELLCSREDYISSIGDNLWNEQQCVLSGIPIFNVCVLQKVGIYRDVL